MSDDRPAFDPDAAAGRLRALPGLSGIAAADLEALPAKGISHDHWRLGRRGLVLRVPRLSQLGLALADSLAYQAAAFARLAASGCTPRLHHVLAPGPGLPAGALLVDEVEGGPPALPRDLPALGRCLAAVHSLPVPPPDARPPLAFQADAFDAALAAIGAGLAYLPRAGVDPAAAAAIRAEHAALAALDTAALPPCPLAPILVDTHPGNFLVRGDGTAAAVDLEKAAYGPPPVDLAHIVLPTSTGWDPDVDTTVSPGDAAAMLAAWRDGVPGALAAGAEPWMLPMRRLVWLRTTAFFLKWRVESEGRGPWSAERLGPAAAGHFRRHVARCLAPAMIASIREAWFRS